MDNGLIKMLWVEDECDTGMVDRKNYIELLGKYDLSFAKNVSDAEKLIFSESYDIIIIDIRIPPGFLKVWQEEYIQGRNQRLGTMLIKKISQQRPDLLKQVGVFTIERYENISPLMEGVIRPEQYAFKGDSVIPEMFEEFVESIFKQKQA